MSLLPINTQLSPLKPSLSIKKGLSPKKTINFATEEALSSESFSRRNVEKKAKKPTRAEILAKIQPKYLSHTTISTLTKLEIEKKFKPNEEEIQIRAKEFEKLQNKVEEQRKKIRESGNKIKEKNFLSFLKHKNEGEFNKLQNHKYQNYLKDLGHQYDQMFFQKGKKSRQKNVWLKWSQPSSLNQIFDKRKEAKLRKKIYENFFISDEIQSITKENEEEFFLTDPTIEKKQKKLFFAKKKTTVGNPFVIYGTPELYDKILKDAEKGLAVSFPGIGITKTPYYKMEEESKRAKLSEKETKFLNEMKFGKFEKIKRNPQHYSLEKIKKELFEVYKYKNQFEENSQIDAISKKLNSIIRSTDRFWEKSSVLVRNNEESSGISHEKSKVFRGFSVGETTKTLENSGGGGGDNGKGFIFTKNFNKIRTQEHII